MSRLHRAQQRRTDSSFDQAVCDAYGWPHDLGDEEILSRLLALNLERSATAEGRVMPQLGQPVEAEVVDAEE